MVFPNANWISNYNDQKRMWKNGQLVTLNGHVCRVRRCTRKTPFTCVVCHTANGDKPPCKPCGIIKCLTKRPPHHYLVKLPQQHNQYENEEIIQ